MFNDTLLSGDLSTPFIATLRECKCSPLHVHVIMCKPGDFYETAQIKEAIKQLIMKTSIIPS